jgi:hypothetical protein
MAERMAQAHQIPFCHSHQTVDHPWAEEIDYAIRQG